MLSILQRWWLTASEIGNSHVASQLYKRANRISNQFILIYLNVVFLITCYYLVLYVIYRNALPYFYLYPLASFIYLLLLVFFLWLKKVTGYLLTCDSMSFLSGVTFTTFLVLATGGEAWLNLFFIPISFLPFFLIRLNFLLKLIGNLLCLLAFLLTSRYLVNHQGFLSPNESFVEMSFWISIVILPIIFISIFLILYRQNKAGLKEFGRQLLGRSSHSSSVSAQKKAELTMTQMQMVILVLSGGYFIPVEGIMYAMLLRIDSAYYINYDIYYGLIPYLHFVSLLALFTWRKKIAIKYQMLFMNIGLIILTTHLMVMAHIPAHLFLIPTACALFYFNRVISTKAIIISFLVLCVSLAFGLHYYQYGKALYSLPEGLLVFSRLLIPSIVFLFTPLIAFLFARESRLAEETLEAERDRSEKLLLNILPEEVAFELKEKGKATPRRFDSVSVLFTDFVGFTKISENIKSEELIGELDRCFSYFDQVTKKYNLEKIKTIGDSYMLAGGLPMINSTHAIDCTLAALEIQSFMSQMKSIKESQGFDYWELRLGIHSGSLVAGVIGEMKFAYDVFGDTVNTASRMESSGTANRINISVATYNLIKRFFDCEYRGSLSVKNKGRVEMYFVNGIIANLSVNGEGRVPNNKFMSEYQSLG